MPSKTDLKAKAAVREAPADQEGNPTGSKDLSKRADKPDNRRAAPSRRADKPEGSQAPRRTDNPKTAHPKADNPDSRELSRQAPPKKALLGALRADNLHLPSLLNREGRLSPRPTGRNSLLPLLRPRNPNRRKRNRRDFGARSSR
jgi:hypothetical protein